MKNTISIYNVILIPHLNM